MADHQQGKVLSEAGEFAPLVPSKAEKKKKVATQAVSDTENVETVTEKEGGLSLAENTDSTFASQKKKKKKLVKNDLHSENGYSISKSNDWKISESLWLAPTSSKRWGELFFLAYTPFWLILCLGIVVPFRLYEKFGEVEYFLLGVVSALPSVLVPLFLVGKEDSRKPVMERYWVKASLWIAIFSYVGNFFWTHYFFTVLGASYTFPSWRFNNVPWTTFFLAHCCFLFYHVVSNITLRRLRHAFGSHSMKLVQLTIEALWILTLSYATAFAEAWAISEFPYYDFVDRQAMYKVGSLFYAIYFIVSYPMFLRLDEDPKDPWSLPRTAIDSLGAAMLVTIILDAWRLFIGPVVEVPNTTTYKECLKYGIPWMS